MRRFLYALRFLTILPLPFGEGDSLDDAAQSAALFPLVGAILGVLLGVAALGALEVWSSGVSAAVVLVLSVILTGGLHWDGAADLADGLGGGRDPETRLAIMKDSRIGVFGALSLITGLLLKGSCIRALLGRGESAPILLGLFVLVGTTARGGQVLGLFLFPYSRREGLGRLFKMRTGKGPLAVAVGTVLLLGWGLFGLPGAGFALGGLAVAGLAGACLSPLLGGLTGDVYGALIEGGEILLLLVITALPRGLPPPGLFLGSGL